MNRSQLGYFFAGVAVGALGNAALPQLKEKFGPLFAGAGAFLQEAFGDAMRDATAAAESMQDAVAGSTVTSGVSAESRGAA